MIGWIFLLIAVALIIGSLVVLRDSANKTHLPEDKIDEIRKRKAELEAQEKADDDQW